MAASTKPRGLLQCFCQYGQKYRNYTNFNNNAQPYLERVVKKSNNAAATLAGVSKPRSRKSYTAGWLQQLSPHSIRHCSSSSQQPEPPTPPLPDVLHKQPLNIDTLAVVKALTQAGFAHSQAEVLCSCLTQVSLALTQHQESVLVTKPQQEIALQHVMQHVHGLQKDMVILEKSEFSQLRNENEKQALAVKHLETMIQDELIKLKGSVQLDLNLEKSRVKDDHSEHEKQLNKLGNRIDTEIAQVSTTFEKYKNDMIRYMAGTALSCLTICLGFYRLWS